MSEPARGAEPVASKTQPPPSSQPQPATPPAEPPADNDKLAQQLEYLQQLLNEVGLAVEDLQQQHRDSMTEMQVATIELSIAAASWIVGVAIDRNMFAIDDLVNSMVEQLNREQPIRVYLNTDDANLLTGLKASADTPRFAEADVEFIAEPGMARGIVRAESTRSILTTDLDDRLADIRRIWMENLNDTQTERRADDPAGREFRRFPERRHTA